MRLGRRLAPYRDLLLVMVSASMASMTISLEVPLLAVVMARHGYDEFAIGLNNAAGGMAIFLMAPFVESLVTKVGAMRLMVLALGLAAGLLLLFPLYVDAYFWFLLRLLLGGTGALLFVLSEAAVNALAPPAERGRVLGAYGTAFSLGYASGPLILALVGSEGSAPFVIGSLILAAGIPPLLGLRSLDSLLRQPKSPRPARLRFWQLWLVAPRPFLGVFVYSVIEMAFFAFLPIYALDQGRSESVSAGLLSAWLAGNILMQWPIGWLADRFDRLAIVIICAVTAILALLAVPFAMTQEPLLWPLFVLMGGTMGALYTLSLALLGDRFAASELTRANMAFVMTYQLGMLLGPASVGAVMTASTSEAFLWSLIAPLAFLGLAALRRRGPEADGASRGSA